MVRDGQIVGSMEGQAVVGEVDCSTTIVRVWVGGSSVKKDVLYIQRSLGARRPCVGWRRSLQRAGSR